MQVPDEQKQLIIDYKQLFSSEKGLRVLEDLKKKCLANEMSYVPNSPDGTAFNEGMRNVWLHISRVMNIDLNEKKQEKAEN